MLRIFISTLQHSKNLGNVQYLQTFVGILHDDVQRRRLGVFGRYIGVLIAYDVDVMKSRQYPDLIEILVSIIAVRDLDLFDDDLAPRPAILGQPNLTESPSTYHLHFIILCCHFCHNKKRGIVGGLSRSTVKGNMLIFLNTFSGYEKNGRSHIFSKVGLPLVAWLRKMKRQLLYYCSISF